MTKADIVNEISNQQESKNYCTKISRSFHESVKDALVKDKNVYLRGFGSFIVKKRAKKTARIFQKILPSLFRNILFRRSNLLNHSLAK
jgi:DNA-binding protein HU-beta